MSKLKNTQQTVPLHSISAQFAFVVAVVVSPFFSFFSGFWPKKGVLLKWLVETIGERYVIVLCFALGVVNNFMYGVARNKRTVFVAIAIGSFVGMSFPTISAIKANNVVRMYMLSQSRKKRHPQEERKRSLKCDFFFPFNC